MNPRLGGWEAGRERGKEGEMGERRLGGEGRGEEREERRMGECPEFQGGIGPRREKLHSRTT